MSKLVNAVVAAELNLDNVKTLANNQITLTNLSHDMYKTLRRLHTIATLSVYGKHSSPSVNAIWKDINEADYIIAEAERVLKITPDERRLTV